MPWWGWIISIFAVLVILAAIFGKADKKEKEVETPSSDCPQCGAKNYSGDQVCPECGRQIDPFMNC